VVSLRAQLAESPATLAQALGELAQARERIGELEARLGRRRGIRPGHRPARGWTSRRHGGRCGRGAAASGHRTKAAAPQGAEAPVQYGPRIAAIIVYLYVGQFLSKQRTAQALAELFSVPLSSGTVAALTARAAGRLGGFLERARDQITASEVAGVR